MLTLICIVVPILAGLAVMFAAERFDFRNSIDRLPYRITRNEFAAGTAVIVPIAFLVTLVIGPNLARDGAINGYKEFYNGSVTQARVVVDECERDGSCVHTYDCDPYEVKVVTREAGTDANGNYVSEISHYETRYHECPYATKEVDYVLDDNLGRTIRIGSNYFDSQPREWRGGKGIPGDVPREPPERWLVAKQNVANGQSDGVTGVFKYSNFILASDNELYEEFDGKIADYKEANLLPEHHTANLGNDVLHDHGMSADKVQIAGGLKVPNLSEWQTRLMRLNAALGSDFQGDMHVVLVPAQKVSNPDDYITALKAHWTNLGKWSISKNAIILAIGVSSDGSTVEWSRAETGMPIGNGALVTALNLRLKDQPFDADALFGNVSTKVQKKGDKLKVAYNYDSAGTVGRIAFVDYPFQRACMKCDGVDDSGVGFVELRDMVPITNGSKILMFLVIMAISSACWLAVLFTDPFGSIRQQHS